MLSFSVNRGELNAPIHQTSHGWELGESLISPIHNKGLESFAVTALNKRAFYSRERDWRLKQIDTQQSVWPLSLAQWNAFKTAALQWPHAFVWIEIDTKTKAITLQSGSSGHGNLFIQYNNNTLRGHWDPTQLFPFINANGLNPNNLVATLYHGDFFTSPSTLFEDIHRLTPNTSATWSPQKPLSIQHAPAQPYIKPQKLPASLDVVDTFWVLLCDTIRQAVPPKSTTPQGILLSGGVDSSLIAAALRHCFSGPIHAVTILMPDEMGKAQQARIHALHTRLNLSPHQIPATANNPYADLFQRATTQGVWPHETYAYDLECRALQALQQAGVSTVFTGEGGDEITIPTREEETQYVPQSALAAFQARQQAMAHFPFATQHSRNTYHSIPWQTFATPYAQRPSVQFSQYFLNQGLWGINPLTALPLVQFVRSLPFEWRWQKKLFRETMRRHGFSEEIARPSIAESFFSTVQTSLHEPACAMAFTALFKNSYLANTGWLNRETLLEDFDRLQTQRHSVLGEMAYGFYPRLAMIELAIRSAERLSSQPKPLS